MTGRRAAGWLAILSGLSLVALLVAGTAGARVDVDSPYTKTQTFSGALRYLRVDRGFPVVEQDPKAAYLIFEYQPPGQRDQASTGTIEVIETSQGVKVFITLPRMPEYHERVLRDELMRKLRQEYGAPRREEPKPPPPDAADGGRG